jgi:uncharacterized protein (TIGR02099 family)
LAAGLLIGALRLVLPFFADLLRAGLEGRVSETLGLEVKVGHLGLRLAGLTPQLILRDAELLDPESGRPRLSLEQLRVDLDPTASLDNLAPRVDSITLSGARLVIKRLQNGRIALSGIGGLQGGDLSTSTFFFGNGRFVLADSDIHWIDEKARTPSLHLSDVQVHFENAGDRHKVAVRAKLVGSDPPARLHLVGDLRGEPGRPSNWNGEVYLHWQGGKLQPVLAGWLPAGLRLESGAVELQSWNRVSGGTLTQSVTRIAIEGLTFRGKSDQGAAVPLRLDRLAGLLRWQRLGTSRDDGWQLEVKDLALTRGGARRPDSDLAIRFAADGDGNRTIEGGAGFLNLADSRDLLAQLASLPPESLDLFGKARPSGELHDLRFRFVTSRELPPRWALSGRVEDLSLDAHGDFPGVRGFSAEVTGNEREGRLALSARKLEFDLPRLFPDPIRVAEATGDVRWERDAQGALLVSAQELAASNADIATRSELSIALPADGGSPFLDLHTEFRNVKAASVRRYIPSKRIKEKLASWLDRAFVEGEIPSGTLLFRGAIADFPFADRQGRLEVLFDVEDGVLDFHPHWPRIEEISAVVRFENHKMEILASKGRFLDSSLANVSVRIPDLSEAVAIEVQGRAEGPFAGGLRVLGETPLRKQLGVLAETFEAEGASRLDLDMAIPLLHKGHKGPLRLAGELTWPRPAALRIADLDIRLTDLAGELRFTEHTLEAESIEAKLWDVPVHLRIDTLQPQGDAGTSTRVRAGGRFPVSVLARQFPSSVWDFLKGAARLELRLDVGSDDLGESVPPIDFELASDLAGLDVSLPVPLGKSASGKRRLELSGRLAAGEELHARGSYGNLGINLGLDRDGDDKLLRLARGTFNLGGSTLPLPTGEGLYLSGSTATLDLQAWLDWSASSESSEGSGSGGGAALRSADLHIGRLLWSGIVLDNVKLDLADGSDRWEGDIRARDFEAKVSIPHQPRREPIRVALDRLDLKGLLDERGEEDQPRPRTGGRPADPRQAHTLDLRVDRLTWGKNPLGRVTLRSRAVPDGLDFTDLTLAGPFVSIEGRGSWRQTDEGPHSSLSLTAKGSDLDEFLRSLELERPFDGAPADVALELDWPGGPLHYSAADLHGRIGVEVGAGSLLDVEPGVGRVLGILSLGALRRHLALDFSDLFGRGFAFERISGEIEVEGGEAVIRRLVIEGPSANISISGSANLVNQELHQIVTVTPRLGTGIAIASAVAGGPLVGAAVFLADRVSGGVVDRLGRHQYVLSGPWTDPQIRRGRLGADVEQGVSQGQLPTDLGRAGAEGSTEPKRGIPRPETPAQTQAGEPVSAADRPRGDSDKNLFLEGD